MFITTKKANNGRIYITIHEDGGKVLQRVQSVWDFSKNTEENHAMAVTVGLTHRHVGSPTFPSYRVHGVHVGPYTYHWIIEHNAHSVFLGITEKRSDGASQPYAVVFTMPIRDAVGVTFK